jgi:UDP-N-acetylmuramoylalanine--D-glutamate ligase
VNRVLVVGLARTGEAVACRLLSEGWEVVVVEDHPGGAQYAGRVARVRAAGARVVEAPSDADARALVACADLVVPSPLVAPAHPVVVAATGHGVPVRSELDVAAERARVPLVAVTGTNGKTTVTTLATRMLEASGLRAGSVGNIGRPLVDAVDDDVDLLVVEASSFQLAFATTFGPAVAVLLAVAPDHLDWHGTFAHYAESKAHVFSHQHADGLLVFDADDPVAAELAARAPGRSVGVSLDAGAEGCFRVAGDDLVDAAGVALVPAAAMRRALPHDRTNALAAAAAALAAGATRAGVRAALAAFETLPHRVELVGEHGGVRYYDDSKATNPHAAVRAATSFDSVVLIAGGRNKGLDLGALRGAAPHVRAVVAIGEAADAVAEAFAGRCPVVPAGSMRDAVRAAAALARPGDAVLLSPGCASFDAYSDYAARGEHFAAEVHALAGGADGGGP